MNNGVSDVVERRKVNVWEEADGKSRSVVENR
jgi:acyl-CoA-binding protein